MPPRAKYNRYNRHKRNDRNDRIINWRHETGFIKHPDKSYEHMQHQIIEYSKHDSNFDYAKCDVERKDGLLLLYNKWQKDQDYAGSSAAVLDNDPTKLVYVQLGPPSEHSGVYHPFYYSRDAGGWKLCGELETNHKRLYGYYPGNRPFPCLKNWYLHQDGKRLYGNVYGHAEIGNGVKVLTDVLVGPSYLKVGLVVTQEDGMKLVLGVPAPAPSALKPSTQMSPEDSLDPNWDDELMQKILAAADKAEAEFTSSSLSPA